MWLCSKRRMYQQIYFTAWTEHLCVLCPGNTRNKSSTVSGICSPGASPALQTSPFKCGVWHRYNCWHPAETARSWCSLIHGSFWVCLFVCSFFNDEFFTIFDSLCLWILNFFSAVRPCVKFSCQEVWHVLSAAVAMGTDSLCAQWLQEPSSKSTTKYFQVSEKSSICHLGSCLPVAYSCMSYLL